ncbi:YkgJ family cysteine cluster protein [Pseudomonas syringae pv. theae]|nr:YkgJ family cysteine cluster protein [Pseudomonas syringae pv. theae]MBL3837329.1 YkgJ family cysteine cluster protein [Pseudomonas syringae pv. theae]MBL3869889.1 YkgJ family cysteine cluster protein [Pseudomonas syringae pv. theae]
MRFACNGCGVCCKGRLIPLTLKESRQWIERGHDVALILEAFDDSLWRHEPARFIHNARRAAEIDSGTAKIKVIAILAANALTQCPNLDEQNRCGIYEDRPLVCRIYPTEISPLITLNPADKVCPPEVWDAGEVIFTDRISDPLVVRQVEESRAADRADAEAKVAICEIMGMTTAAWKERALAVYQPDRVELLEAIQYYDTNPSTPGGQGWSVRSDNPGLSDILSGKGVEIVSAESADYIFHRL